MNKVLALFFCLFICSCGSGLVNEESQLPETPKLIYIVTKIEPGDMCPYGGNLIKVGNDVDGDGLLNSEETNASELLCNDEQGVIMTETPIAPGEDCPLGGVMITTGADLNGDGIIDKIDPNKTTYICNVINDNVSDGGNLPLISVTYDGASGLCSGGKVTIKNNTEQLLNISFVSNYNIFPVAFRDESFAPYDGSQTIPSSLPPLGEAAINLNIQPDKEGYIDVLYAIKTWNSDKSYTFAETEKCEIQDNSVISSSDIVSAILDIYLSSYKGEPDKNNRCKSGKECMFALPYGIRKGLYPLDIKVDWGDGASIDSINVRNISMEPLMSHTFNTPGRNDVKIAIKVKNRPDYLDLRPIRVTID